MKITQPDVSGEGGNIGGPIVGGTPNSVLYVDPSGNLGQDNPAFTYLQGTHNLVLGSTSTGIFDYNTVDQSVAYERLVSQWQSNIYTIGSYFGTGTTGRSIQIGIQQTVTSTTLANGRLLTINSSATVPSGNFDFFSSTGAGPSIITFQGTGNSSSTLQNWVSIQPTINQTLTASYTALLITPFEQSIGSGNHYLINAGTSTAGSGGGSFTQKFSVQNNGTTVINGAFVPHRITVADVPYVTLITDYLIAYSSITASRAVTLTVTGVQVNQQFIIKDESGNAGVVNTIVITPASGTIDGAANKTINAAYGELRVYFNGTNFFTW